MHALGIFLPWNIYSSFYKGIYPIINSTRKNGWKKNVIRQAQLEATYSSIKAVFSYCDTRLNKDKENQDKDQQDFVPHQKITTYPISVPYQHALSQHRSQMVSYAASRGTAQNCDPRGEETEVILSCFPQCWKWRVAATDPSKPPLRVSPRSSSPPPQAFFCAKVCRTVCGKITNAYVPSFFIL